jgi:hypothetical protein
MNDAEMLQEAEAIYRALEPKFRELVRIMLTPYVKRQPAIVVSSDNANKIVIVKLPHSSDTSDQYMTLKNVSNQNVYKGNDVYIESWGGDLSSAVVSGRIGGV